MPAKQLTARVVLKSHRSWITDNNKHTQLDLIEEDDKLVSKRKASEKDRRVIGEFHLSFEAVTGEVKAPQVKLKGTAKMRQSVSYSATNDKSGKRQFILVLTYERDAAEAETVESCLGRGANLVFVEVATTKDALEDKEKDGE